MDAEGTECEWPWYQCRGARRKERRDQSLASSRFTSPLLLAALVWYLVCPIYMA